MIFFQKLYHYIIGINITKIFLTIFSNFNKKPTTIYIKNKYYMIFIILISFINLTKNSELK